MRRIFAWANTTCFLFTNQVVLTYMRGPLLIQIITAALLFSVQGQEKTLQPNPYSAATPQGYATALTRVVDGDTLVVMINLGFDTYVSRILRLVRIDAPELKTEQGKKAQEYIMSVLTNAKIIIQPHGKDRYGRWLASVQYRTSEGEWEDLSDALLANNLAKPYQPK